MIYKKLRGFKFPDIELSRWFFKHNLSNGEGKKVLELGSHNGNNLSLFASFDYECLGVDLDDNNTQNARYNFENIFQILPSKFSFFTQNMLDFAKNQKNINADVLLIPNVINYLTKSEFIGLLRDIRKNRLYKRAGENANGGGHLLNESLIKNDTLNDVNLVKNSPGFSDKNELDQRADFFIRARSVKDHRYGLGVNLKNGSFRLDYDEFSGEKGCICTAYQEYELLELLQNELGLSDFELLTSENINVKDKVYIKDSDIIIYGKIS